MLIEVIKQFKNYDLSGVLHKLEVKRKTTYIISCYMQIVDANDRIYTLIAYIETLYELLVNEINLFFV